MANATQKLLASLQSYLMQNLQKSQQEATVESPYLTSLGKDATGYQNFLRGGDYAQPPGGYQLNMSPPAGQYRDAQLQNNPLGGGTAAAGTHPSGAYQLNHLDMQDRLAGGYSQAKQQNIDQGADSANKVLLGLGGLEQNRRTSAANQQGQMVHSLFSAYNNKKPSFLSSLLKGAVAAAPGIMMAM